MDIGFTRPEGGFYVTFQTQSNTGVDVVFVLDYFYSVTLTCSVCIFVRVVIYPKGLCYSIASYVGFHSKSMLNLKRRMYSL